MAPRHTPFDAVLVVGFGGPEGPADVRPFLANVLKGRRVAPERVEEVAKHYEHFGGVSPLNAITRRQAEGLKVRLAEHGLNLPVSTLHNKERRRLGQSSQASGAHSVSGVRGSGG